MVNVTAEEIKNCGSCNKPVSKAKRYYRNGRYYCNRHCWEKAQAKLKNEENKE